MMDEVDPASLWFDEKAPQIDHGLQRAFGIQLESRHDRALEMAEMLTFAYLLARNNLNLAVEAVHYNSNSCCATLQFRGSVDWYGPPATAIKELALQALGQFEWDGCVLHGRGALAPPEPDDPDLENPF